MPVQTRDQSQQYNYLNSDKRGGSEPVKARVALWCFIFLALALTSFVISVVAPNPFFAGDEAHRMHMAQYPVVRMGHRVWLPTLQAHIWVLYKFQSPSWAFKLVPCVYYFLSIVLIGLLSFNQTGRTRLGLTFSLALAFLFARQQMIMYLGMSLMQEIIGIALLFLLLQAGALELKKKWWVLLAVVPALAGC